MELIYSNNDNATTLSDVIDHTVSPMGGRLLKRWIVLPLKDEAPIQERLDIVESFVNNTPNADSLHDQLSKIGDLERLISKVAAARISPREVVYLKQALFALEPIKQLCENSENDALQKLASR